MSAALANDGFLPSAAPDQEGCDEVARMPNPTGSAVTHEQIIGALGRVEGLIEAESEARRDFRDAFVSRLETVEKRTADIAADVHVIKHRLNEAKPQGAVAAIAQLFERQPLLSVVFAVVILALGSGGVISIWEAVSK